MSHLPYTVFGANVTNLNEPPRALALATSLLGRCKQKQRGLRGLLCRWPSITEWEMYITAQGCRLRNDLYCVEWEVKLYYTILFNIQREIMQNIINYNKLSYILLLNKTSVSYRR